MIQIRVLGTEEECSQFSAMIRERVDPKYIRSISKWFKNERRGEFSTEGRVYIYFRDTFSYSALEGPKELPSSQEAQEEESPRKGRCYFCGSKDNLMVLMWDNNGYAGACPKCAGKYIRQQWIGNYLKEVYPDIYEELDKTVKPVRFRGILHDPSGYHEIWG